MITPFQRKVYNVVKKIPHGRVSTYRAVARAIGKPRAARAVGGALNKNLFRSVPCHRVVRSDGLIGGYARGVRSKIGILQGEGVEIIRGRVDLARFGFLWRETQFLK